MHGRPDRRISSRSKSFYRNSLINHELDCLKDVCLNLYICVLGACIRNEFREPSTEDEIKVSVVPAAVVTFDKATTKKGAVPHTEHEFSVLYSHAVFPPESFSVACSLAALMFLVRKGWRTGAGVRRRGGIDRWRGSGGRTEALAGGAGMRTAGPASEEGRNGDGSAGTGEKRRGRIKGGEEGKAEEKKWWP
ncbi:hypothetical protein GUJ93_ZPchr0003g17763 [Zizania palustris]|uniref:Uncharacterized protein n=1 Tax=Zizania palustris TaxID=103762 RepID=A0A8J5SL28_ZIZPA|nr:hypothetical protein GUJ93_ZPchr0003g17763 [Zizania palustris]